MNPKNKRDLTGQKFGRLTVLYRCNFIKSNGSLWYCRCECGTEGVYRQTSLLNGRTKSCGCLRIDTMSKTAYKHGIAGSPIYYTFYSMLRRAKYHQSRGHNDITVCDEWKTLEGFSEWAYANGWEKGKWIIRKNKYMGYNPDNCEIITKE